jgi:NAD(P)H-dependent flavin oxidoreductase YrpB (nitropropane dioxygenase family)
MDLFDRIGLEHPVVQAGMGGGVAGPELAAAVSAAGGLGTVGIMAPPAFGAALRKARDRAPGRPIAANLLVPFTRRAHITACVQAGAALVVFHGGLGVRWFAELRNARIPVFCTVGSVAQARAALAAKADGLVVQGVEAGGHLAADQPLDAVLAGVVADLQELAADVPVLAAGGVATADDVRRLVDAGATAAVAGTRFLLTDESRAHPAYKRRVLAADRTLRTLLFGLGWPMAHRVVPNAATERWCARSDLGPRWVRRLERASAPLGRVLPLSSQGALIGLQRPALPLFSPGLPLRGMPDHAVDRCALYAGETIHRIDDIVPAAAAVARLTP